MYIELGLLAAFGAMICWGFGDFFIQRSARKVGDFETLAFIGSLGAVALLPLIINDLSVLLQPANLALMLVLGIVTFFAAAFNFEALKKGKLSVIDVLLEVELPITVILGMVFFGEVISGLQLTAMMTIMLGIILIAAGSSASKMFRSLEKGAVLALIAAIGMGFVNFLTAAGAKNVSPLMAIWLPWLIVAAICFPMVAKRDGAKKMFNHAYKFRHILLGAAVFDTAAWMFFAFAVVDNSLAITIAITESYPALAMLLGLKFNKEKIMGHQYIGALMALGASVTLGFIA